MIRKRVFLFSATLALTCLAARPQVNAQSTSLTADTLAVGTLAAATFVFNLFL